MPPKNFLFRFVMISASTHLILLGAEPFLGSMLPKPEFSVQTADTSVDVVFIEIQKEEPAERENIAENPVITEAETEPEPVPQKEEKDPDEKVPEQIIPAKGVITRADPEQMKNPPPVYPAEARRRGWEGTVVLDVLVNRAGYPEKVGIIKSSGYVRLDNAAVRAVRKWRFRPGTIGGVPVVSSARIPIRFELRK